METYKDVIVSQPPAMYAQSGYTTHFAVENYKGILLCKRPSNLGSAARFGGGGGSDGYGEGGASSAPFIPSNPTGNPLGYGPSKESRDARAEQEALRVANQRQRQTKSSQTLSRHRRWLRTFARQMKSMRESDRQLEVEAAQRAARMREAEKRKRAEQQQQTAIAATSENASAPAYNMHKAMEAHVAATLKTTTAATVAPSSRKPKWALTEEEAMDAELNVDRDLLDFAENLDYEKFITDFEVAEALCVMRDRVEEIARANNWSVEDIRRASTNEDDDLNSITPSEAQLILRSKQPQPKAGDGTAAGSRAALPEALAVHTHDWDSSSTGRGRLLKKAISRDALALAERLFAASPSLRKIHTRHSLARVLQRCALDGHVNVTENLLLQQASKASAVKGGGGGGGVGGGTTSHSPAALDPPAIAEPLVVKVSADAIPAPHHSADGVSGDSAAGAMPARILRELQQSKQRTQGLPYLYRCPAI